LPHPHTGRKRGLRPKTVHAGVRAEVRSRLAHLARPSIRYYLSGGRARAGKMPGNLTGPEDKDESPSSEGASVEELSSEIDRCVAEATEFVKRFKEMADQLQLPRDDSSFQALAEAEALLLEHSRIARSFAAQLQQRQVPGQSASQVRTALAKATRQIRRASLLLQVQVFRLDRMLDKMLLERPRGQ